ncbi:MAG: helix-turn-helix domain-containing protein [Lachnospiraceae bacterium]|nr:helix-turn-helix domain-containing protein [Lachnospiraceae bacterium]
MSKDVKNHEMDRLMDAMVSLQSREEAYAFLEDICTVKELEALSQRLEVATLLKEKITYQEIAEKTGASTTTVSRVNRALNYGCDGYDIVLSRIED